LRLIEKKRNNEVFAILLGNPIYFDNPEEMLKGLEAD